MAALVGAATGSEPDTQASAAFNTAISAAAEGASSQPPPSSPSPARDGARRPPPRFADVSSPVSIGNGACSFGSALDGALRSMIVYQGSPPVGRPGRVALAGQRLTPTLIATADEGGFRPGFRNYEASIRLNPPAVWNGLRLTGLHLSTGWEWSARSLELADRPARLQAALRAMSISVPLPPGRREIPTDACVISIQIQTRPQGSALTCSGGCG